MLPLLLLPLEANKGGATDIDDEEEGNEVPDKEPNDAGDNDDDDNVSDDENACTDCW